MKKTTINKIMKVVMTLVIIAIIATMLSAVFATGAASIIGTLNGNTEAATQITPIANKIIGIVQIICYAAAVIMLVMLGVKFITASPEGKAEIKKSAIIYIVGAVIVFAAGSLLSVIANVASTTVK